MISQISLFRILKTACLIVIAQTLLAGPTSAEDGTIRIEANYARVIKLDRPISRVIIGNAEIADATVSDAQTIVLTGKKIGTTNLVILDTDGTAVVDEHVLVSLEEFNTMQVYRQTDRQVLSCTPSCWPLETK